MNVKFPGVTVLTSSSFPLLFLCFFFGDCKLMLILFILGLYLEHLEQTSLTIQMGMHSPPSPSIICINFVSFVFFLVFLKQVYDHTFDDMEHFKNGSSIQHMGGKHLLLFFSLSFRSFLFLCLSLSLLSSPLFSSFFSHIYI